VRNRILGYAVAGAVLIGVSVWSASLAHSRKVPVATAPLEYTLKDMNGTDLRLADLKGKPLIINFWATWCPPCVLEQPELVELAEEYKSQGVQFIGISYDDDPEQVKKYAAEYKVPYPLLIGKDREEMFDAFGIGDGLPTTLFVRPDGKVDEHLVGINTKPFFREHIEALLQK
jgi:thiol-disulfide isomerase/thioredoxin